MNLKTFSLNLGASPALESVYVRSTRFASVSATSGQVSLPTQATVVLDDFGGTVDAVVGTISGGRPTTTPATTAGGVIITTSFDSSGNYVLSGTPSSYPVAIIYRVKQTLINYDSTANDLMGEVDIEHGATLTPNNHGMLVSGPGNVLTVVAPDASTTKVWTSGGLNADPSWQPAASGSGTVTSVDMTVPTFLNVTGNPVTTAGTLAVTLSGTALPIANGGTALTALPTVAAASTFAAWDASKNLSANNIIGDYATFSTDQTLTVASPRKQRLTGSTSRNVTLPVASTLTVGHDFWFFNDGDSGNTIVVKSSGANTITTIGGLGTTGGGWGILTCILASGTSAASWSYKYIPPMSSLNVANAIVHRDNSGTFATSTINIAADIRIANAGLKIFDTDSSHYVIIKPGDNVSADRTFTLTIGNNDSGLNTSAVAGVTTISAFGATLTDDADASTARTTLGLGTIATQAANSVSISGGTITGITDLTVADGGTGASTLTAHGILLGNGTSAIAVLGVGATGTILKGTTGADPSFTSTPVLGAASGTTGSLGFSGTTSGTVTTIVKDAAGTYNWVYPTTAGTSGFALTSGGGGTTAMTWTALLGSVGLNRVRAYNGNGYGATSTAIRRFSNTVTAGSGINYADDANLAGTFTIVTAGVYSASVMDYSNTAGYMCGASVNSAELTTTIISITESTKMAFAEIPAANHPGNTTGSRYLAVNDVVRMHCSLTHTSPATNSECYFELTQVGW